MGIFWNYLGSVVLRYHSSDPHHAELGISLPAWRLRRTACGL